MRSPFGDRWQVEGWLVKNAYSNNENLTQLFRSNAMHCKPIGAKLFYQIPRPRKHLFTWFFKYIFEGSLYRVFGKYWYDLSSRSQFIDEILSSERIVNMEYRRDLTCGHFKYVLVSYKYSWSFTNHQQLKSEKMPRRWWNKYRWAEKYTLSYNKINYVFSLIEARWF